ncbi:uncharacterized protein PRCAT00005712001 [Priceomyces carsonii]|uniref:uncharacterized protein n=1 Tax=Priceomyces carsonii TaxID=28549 RepID=UPI002ED9862B|nr:unnamed protein product [Priceomyces carsonii]
MSVVEGAAGHVESSDTMGVRNDIDEEEERARNECSSESLADKDNADPFQYNMHNEAIFDDEKLFPCPRANSGIITYDAKDPELVNHATLKALAVQLTSPDIIDYNLVCDFFLTYRIFVSSEEVMSLLLTRLIWSLHYINSKDESNVTVGKLVLLRLFVVLRHWLLNYFTDDFESNLDLCELFIKILNAISIESHLVNESMVFEKRIVCDLKIHWLLLMNQFWGTKINIDEISDKVLKYSLPKISELTMNISSGKRETHFSIHTNPSYRRSAMLSLYDSNVHHKCMIFDDLNSNDENPQLTINNLLSHHRSSSNSIKNNLHEMNVKQGPKELNNNARKPLQSSNKHNHMNLKDSSLGLKKISLGDSNSPKQDLDSPNPGFSANGLIKLPSSKVKLVLPPTPVKKMEYVIKSEAIGSPTRRSKKASSLVHDLGDVSRKKSIKKLVESWKKSFANHKEESSSRISLASATELDSLVELAINVIPAETNDNRFDVLSARIVDELEYLIRFYVKNPASASTIEEDDGTQELSDIRQSVNESPENNSDILASTEQFWIVSKSEQRNSNQYEKLENPKIDINDLSELNILKIDNLINQEKNDKDNLRKIQSGHETVIESQDSSFQRPISIDWNDMNLENSEDAQKEENEEEVLGNISQRMVRTGTQYFDVETNLPLEPDAPFESNNSLASTSASASTPSDLTNYNAEVSDLGIAVSPKLMKDLQYVRRISFDADYSVSRKISLKSRSSTNSIFRRDLIKSYVSYDSAFSLSGVSQKSTTSHEITNSNLKKKHAYNDLRSVANWNKETGQRANNVRSFSANSIVSRSSSLRKSVRFSSLCALTEANANRVSTNNARKGSLRSKSSNQLDLDDSSIFSHSARISREIKGDKDSFCGSDTSDNSVAIPGISNYALKELAAIPDESLESSDPIRLALYKLEGEKRRKKKLKDVATRRTNEANEASDLETLEANDVSLSSKTDKDQETSGEKMLEEIENDAPLVSSSLIHNDRVLTSSILENNAQQQEAILINDTEEILNEINNANTEDVIDLNPSIGDVTQELPLSPRENEDALLTNKVNGEEPILDLPGKERFVFTLSELEEQPDEQSPQMILDTYDLSTDLLKVENVMDNRHHISFVLGIDSKTLARHFTAIEKDLLQEIDWKELIELKWNKELIPVNSWLEIIVNDDYYKANKGVSLVIARFNLMVNWIISEILLTSSQKERINLTSRFIHIAQNCYVFQNFSTLMQIILALSSEKIQKLKNTWKNLPPGDILMLKNLEELSSPIKNFLKIRLAINQIKPSKGCIPFAGLYLSDLIFNAERPTFIKKSKPEELGESSKMGTSNIQTSESEKVINFSKFRTSVHIVKSLSQCIEWSNYYCFDINEDILSKCLYINSLDEDEMNICLSKLADF